MSAPSPQSQAPLRRRRRGANALEFALTMPLFVALTFGIIDYGWFFLNNAIADAAVFRGCRQGSLVDPADGNPSLAAVASMDPILSVVNQGCAEVCTFLDTNEVPYRRLECTVSFDFVPITQLTPVPATIVASTVSRLEWQRAR